MFHPELRKLAANYTGIASKRCASHDCENRGGDSGFALIYSAYYVKQCSHSATVLTEFHCTRPLSRIKGHARAKPKCAPNSVGQLAHRYSAAGAATATNGSGQSYGIVDDIVAAFAHHSSACKIGRILCASARLRSWNVSTTIV